MFISCKFLRQCYHIITSSVIVLSHKQFVYIVELYMCFHVNHTEINVKHERRQCVWPLIIIKAVNMVDSLVTKQSIRVYTNIVLTSV